MRTGGVAYFILLAFLDGERFAGPGSVSVKIELDNLERRIITCSLDERRGWLIEIVEDTTRTVASRRRGLRELALIAAALRKLRPTDRAGAKPESLKRNKE